MLSLMLLRHAKSSWDDPALDDFDRPLASRGREAAARMGAYMTRRGLAPDLILSSTAVRARETLNLVLPHLASHPRRTFACDLYLASPATLLAHVHKVEPATAGLMIVGHNPGMHGLAVSLAGSGETRNLKALANKFPTAALAVLTFDVQQWSDVATCGGHLAEFMVPKRLPEA
jgi:phosphohistidine phosphatase